MINRKYFLKGVLLTILTLTSITCSNKNMNKILEFYKKNKHNEKIKIFDSIDIFPIREMWAIRLPNSGGYIFYVQSYDSKNDSIKIKDNAAAFNELKKNTGLGYEEAVKKLKNIFKIYKSIGAISIFGFPNGSFIEFVITKYDVVVFVKDEMALSDFEKKLIDRYKKNVTYIFDDHWFAYRSEKGFNYD